MKKVNQLTKEQAAEVSEITEELVVEEDPMLNFIEEVKKDEEPKEVIVKPEYPDLRDRVKELEDELA